MTTYSLVGVDLGSVMAGCSRFEGSELAWAKPWKLRTYRKGEHPGTKWARLRGFLEALDQPDYVAYEKVVMHQSSAVNCSRCGNLRKGQYRGRGAGLRCAKCGNRAARRTRMNVDAAHAYGAGEALLLEWCFGFGVTPIEIHTSAVKIAAVGKGGGAGTAKEDILLAARARWPGVEFKNHDVADAAFIGLAAAQQLGWIVPRGTTQPLFQQ